MAGTGGRECHAGSDSDRPRQAGRGRGGAPAGLAGRPGVQPRARSRPHRRQRPCLPGPRHRIANPAGLSGVMCVIVMSSPSSVHHGVP